MFGSSILIGDPNTGTNNSYFFRRFIGPESSFENTDYIKATSKFIKKLKENVQDGDSVITSWPFHGILKSNNIQRK